MNCKKCNTEFTPSKGLISYCSIGCRNSRGVCSQEKKDRISKGVKSSEKSIQAWKNQIGVPLFYKGLGGSRKKKERIESICKHCKKPIIHTISVSKQYHSECWKMCSGGYRENSTIKHASDYGGFKMHSGSELRFAKFCDSNGIEWAKNNKESFDYVGVDGKKHRYYPDFYLPFYNVWVEIKGKYYADIDENVEIKKSLIKNYLYIDSKKVKKMTFEDLVSEIGKVMGK